MCVCVAETSSCGAGVWCWRVCAGGGASSCGSVARYHPHPASIYAWYAEYFDCAHVRLHTHARTRTRTRTRTHARARARYGGGGGGVAAAVVLVWSWAKTMFARGHMQERENAYILLLEGTLYSSLQPVRHTTTHQG